MYETKHVRYIRNLDYFYENIMITINETNKRFGYICIENILKHTGKYTTIK